MTPVKRFARNMVQMIRKQFYEGPDPPARIASAVRHFIEVCPNATKEQWREFAELHAQECYRTGYVRGLEWAERDLDRKPKDDPDVLAEQMAEAELDHGFAGPEGEHDDPTPDIEHPEEVGDAPPMLGRRVYR